MQQFVVKMMSLMIGKKVGEDEFGNMYYAAPLRKATPSLKKEKRWVVFNKSVEATNIPPLWHAWLHATSDQIPAAGVPTRDYAWQKPHLPNLTGTIYAYRPQGHVFKGGKRAKATGDYEKWHP